MLFVGSILVLIVTCSGQEQFTCSKTTNDSLVLSLQDFYRGYKQLEDGWIALFNGFQYKKTSQTASWHGSRRTCQNWNADLVVYGVQDYGMRELLYRALSIDQRVWVGITDEAEEGIWKWVNGRRAVNNALFWGLNQPDNYNNIENCAELRTDPSYGYLSLNDNQCYYRSMIAVCEKPI